MKLYKVVRQVNGITEDTRFIIKHLRPGYMGFCYCRSSKECAYDNVEDAQMRVDELNIRTSWEDVV